MTTPAVLDRFSLCVGDGGEFAIDIVLPSLALTKLSGDASDVLNATDGYLAFVTGGANVFELDGGPRLPSVLRDHVALSMSMFLEWVWYDRCYRCDKGPRSFSEVIAGESSPPVVFDLVGDAVQVTWDFGGWKRRGMRYTNVVGRGEVEYRRFLLHLAAAVDGVVAACNWRCLAGGCLSQWEQWLDGQRPYQEDFRKYVRARV